jgi:ATP-dependent helicase HrpA
MVTVRRLEAEYSGLLETLPPTRARSPEAIALGWQLEELRVSLFAQTLGAKGSVSEARIRKAIALLRA